ncbi:hypothetical protein B5X24_HaOG201423 [Helicoverpa armigera]|nr:hypothetical protein B5X24_HaOG201423 [Helicoverpa armigera]
MLLRRVPNSGTSGRELVVISLLPSPIASSHQSHNPTITRRHTSNTKKQLEMYRNVVVLIVLWATAESANYQRYAEPGDARYATYSSSSYTTVNPYNQNLYKSGGSYGSDIANFPEVTRYPNYSPGSSTYSSSYNSYTTPRSNVFYPPGGDITPRYGDTSYRQGYGQGYGQTGQGYGQVGQGYGTGYSSYEMPFMKNIRDYCVNRSPQQGIWVDSLMGMWYGVEFIQHLAGDSRIDYARTCIVIHISEPMDQNFNNIYLCHNLDNPDRVTKKALH